MKISCQDSKTVNLPIEPNMILEWAHFPSPGRCWIFSILLCKSPQITMILIVRLVNKEFYAVGRIKSRKGIIPCKVELSGKDLFYLMEKVF